MNFQNLIDFYEWKGINVFEGCTVPAPFDINLVIDNIMKRCGLLTPTYNDPEVFKNLTKMWFDSNQWNFEHLAKVFNANYSPIENVYESDHWVEKNTGTDSRVLSGADSEIHSGRDTVGDSGTETTTHNTKNTQSGNDSTSHGLTTEHQVSAYNSGGYQSDTKDINSGTDTTTYGKTDSLTGTDSTTFDKVETTDHGQVIDFSHNKNDDFTHGHNITYDRLRHGNIGVTTNNQLINEELDMLEKFNPYDWIAAKFERENFLQIY